MSWVIETCFDFLSNAIGCSGCGDFRKEGLVLEYICYEDLNLIDIGTVGRMPLSLGQGGSSTYLERASTLLCRCLGRNVISKS